MNNFSTLPGVFRQQVGNAIIDVILIKADLSEPLAVEGQGLRR